MWSNRKAELNWGCLIYHVLILEVKAFGGNTMYSEPLQKEAELEDLPHENHTETICWRSSLHEMMTRKLHVCVCVCEITANYCIIMLNMQGSSKILGNRKKKGTLNTG